MKMVAFMVDVLIVKIVKNKIFIAKIVRCMNMTNTDWAIRRITV